MTRESIKIILAREALLMSEYNSKTILDGENTLRVIDMIFDDFESRTCENCKYFLSSYQYVCETEWTDKSEFSCAKWEPKDE